MQTDGAAGHRVVEAVRSQTGRALPRIARATRRCLFTENETNTQRIFGVANRTPYVKDSINDYIVHGQTDGRQSGEERNQGRGPLSLTVPARRLPGGSAATLGRCAGRAVPKAMADGRALRQPFRRCHAGPPPRGRRVLPQRHSRLALRRSGQRHAAGPGRHVVEQAILSLRRGQVAGGAGHRSLQGDRARPLPATTTGTTCTTAM